MPGIDYNVCSEQGPRSGVEAQDTLRRGGA